MTFNLGLAQKKTIREHFLMFLEDFDFKTTM